MAFTVSFALNAKLSFHIQRVSFVVLSYYLFVFNLCLFVYAVICEDGRHTCHKACEGYMLCETGNLSLLCNHAGCPQTPMESPASTSYLAVEAPGLHMHAMVSIFAWVLNRSIALYPLSHYPS